MACVIYFPSDSYVSLKHEGQDKMNTGKQQHVYELNQKQTVGIIHLYERLKNFLKKLGR